MVIFLTLNMKEVQDRCREEILATLGTAKAAVTDMTRLPYVLATIAEVGGSCLGARTCLLEGNKPGGFNRHTSYFKEVFFARLQNIFIYPIVYTQDCPFVFMFGFINSVNQDLCQIKNNS